jgi:hypothetical protein
MARLGSFALTRADDPDMRAAIDDNIVGFDRLLEEVLADGQRSGTVPGDMSAADVREMILGLLLAAGLRRVIDSKLTRCVRRRIVAFTLRLSAGLRTGIRGYPDHDKLSARGV